MAIALVISIIGALAGYFVYYLYSDFPIILQDLSTFSLALRDLKILTLYLSPLSYGVLGVCFTLELLPAREFLSESFLVTSGVASVYSLFVYFYILTTFGKYFLDLYHIAFAPLTILVIYLALKKEHEYKANLFALGVLLGIFLLTFSVLTNYTLGWEFPHP